MFRYGLLLFQCSGRMLILGVFSAVLLIGMSTLVDAIFIIM